VSDPVPCLIKPGHVYINVVVMTDKTHLPLIMPYVYHVELRVPAKSKSVQKDAQSKMVTVRNSLQEWVFINSRGEEVRSSVNSYTKIRQ
jgi:hypothetical protein